MSDIEARLAALEKREAERAERDRARELGPPRAPNHSLVEVIEKAVGHAVEQAVTPAIEQAITPKFNSLVPMQEEQLDLLKASAGERERRAEREAAERETRDKRNKAYTLALAVIGLMVAVCETVRALLSTPHH